MNKFTIEIEGRPDEVERMWAAFTRQYNVIEEEANSRAKRLALEFGLTEHDAFRLTGRSSLRGKVTFPIGDA